MIYTSLLLLLVFLITIDLISNLFHEAVAVHSYVVFLTYLQKLYTRWIQDTITALSLTYSPPPLHHNGLNYADEYLSKLV